MPYATATTPFTGDNDITDFMTNVWIPFARDDCKWADNQAPTTSPSRNRFWTHRVERGGSPVADLSPFTPKPPYAFFETFGDQMAHYTGSGIDTTKESWNQPGNPNNYWNIESVDATSGLKYINGRGIITNDIIGTFQKYWLFSDAEGRYIHCVIQPRAREYRHFHIGLFNALHPELDPDCFYVTGHFWNLLYSRLTSHNSAGDNGNEHAPYQAGNRDGGHRIPFVNQSEGTEAFGLPNPAWRHSFYYMPGVFAGSPNTDWFTGIESTSVTTDRGSLKDDGLSPRGEGVAIPPYYGVAQTNAYSSQLGGTLWWADKTFTSNTNSLVPIYVACNTVFSGLNRFGVLAQVPDVYRINMRDYAPGEEITVGSDTYVVFPVINDDAANCQDGEGYSGYEGLAYKKITATVP